MLFSQYLAFFSILGTSVNDRKIQQNNSIWFSKSILDTICFQVLGNLQLDSPKTAHHVTQGKTIILNKEGIISLNVNALVRKEWEEFLCSKSKDKNYKTDEP